MEQVADVIGIKVGTTSEKLKELLTAKGLKVLSLNYKVGAGVGVVTYDDGLPNSSSGEQTKRRGVISVALEMEMPPNAMLW